MSIHYIADFVFIFVPSERFFFSSACFERGTHLNASIWEYRSGRLDENAKRNSLVGGSASTSTHNTSFNIITIGSAIILVLAYRMQIEVNEIEYQFGWNQRSMQHDALSITKSCSSGLYFFFFSAGIRQMNALQSLFFVSICDRYLATRLLVHIWRYKINNIRFVHIFQFWCEHSPNRKRTALTLLWRFRLNIHIFLFFFCSRRIVTRIQIKYLHNEWAAIRIFYQIHFGISCRRRVWLAYGNCMERFFGQIHSKCPATLLPTTIWNIINAVDI